MNTISTAYRMELEKYFWKFYGFGIDLIAVKFPEKESFPNWMAVPTALNEDDILGGIGKYCRVATSAYISPLHKGILRRTEQRRPQGFYAFAHRGGDRPDDCHTRKSYWDGGGMPFLNAKEYLLVSGFHFYTKGRFMDAEGGRTRTSSLWVGGRVEFGGDLVVRGGWDVKERKLFLDYGYRSDRYSDKPLSETTLTAHGLRELVLY